MNPQDPVRTVRVVSYPSRIATLRDLAIILVCVALLLGTFAELFLRVREVPPSGATVTDRHLSACVSLR